MNITKNLGMLVLAIYLILAGITLLFHITIPTIIMGILAKCSRHMSGPSVLSTLHQEWG